MRIVKNTLRRKATHDKPRKNTNTHTDKQADTYRKQNFLYHII